MINKKQNRQKQKHPTHLIMKFLTSREKKVLKPSKVEESHTQRNRNQKKKKKKKSRLQQAHWKLEDNGSAPSK